MKNQYVGDINDFVKYGLLRALTDRGARSSLVAWMRTPDAPGPDGRKLAYLGNASRWRHHDPELFDALHRIVVVDGARAVTAIAQAALLPNARFHGDIVPVAKAQRELFIDGVLRSAIGQNLVFFDPDNGLEIASCSMGRKKSDKYLLWSELARTYRAGHTVLIYQHFIRKRREDFIVRQSAQIAEMTGAGLVMAFRTPHVVFFLAAQNDAVQYYVERAKVVAWNWKGVIGFSVESDRSS